MDFGEGLDGGEDEGGAGVGGVYVDPEFAGGVGGVDVGL